MKRTRMCALACALMLLILLTLLSGCSSIASVEPESSAAPEIQEDALKTGLAVVGSADASRSATGDVDGLARTDLTIVALTMDANGVIHQCMIDGLQAEIRFDASGRLTTDPGTAFPTKNALGQEYGLHRASSIGKEWNEQAAAFAAYVCGRTADEIASMALNEGRPADAELMSSVTISVSDFIRGIQAAAENARPLGAQKGDMLHLACLADAASATDGAAQLDTAIAAVTLSGGRISSCMLDSLNTRLDFDGAGQITSDTAAAILSRRSDPQWLTQAESLCAQLRGSTPTEAQATDLPGLPADTLRRMLAGMAQDDGAQAAL